MFEVVDDMQMRDATAHMQPKYQLGLKCYPMLSIPPLCYFPFAVNSTPPNY